MKDIKACIFNIQKYSIHDGPGIRTVVFFNGCPLSCLWCSNPESQDSKIQIICDKTKCTQCLHCIDVCQNNAISLNDNHIKINSNNCISCFACKNSCPHKALSAEGEFLTLSHVMNEVMKDEMFYEESNGGVTLSGGEVLMQHEFGSELLKLLKNRNIHTAIETTGYASNETFSKFIQDVDLLLFDIKHYDREKHFKVTNVYNDLIIENLKIAINSGKEVIIRIPVIPNINSSLEDAKEFCKLLKFVNAKKINLLPFHQFGQKKYELLNKPYAFQNTQQLHEEDLLEYKNIFLKNGFDCYF
ncbi:glycyl-radical enzyme activating protein [Clostridium beijerinckii]|uniref:glycyl-radical enzyme activating protein n=1 Tax=Clostridium beijerinckii TaxID=1520 RepID=UPI001493FAE8|nr:glycyl-radical enzyme activating protein [Clostridium beijerinckii]NOW07664.1 pyruvate formate lyase activating enzyme [Clostridium beijerinckii]NYC04563.1 pyruvate formate lyase activating enzyme [Clostridium beijerinckii]